ncbi:hypothetical protein [Streptomyces violascens]|uniref:hypothetical protein n=1 Tax=Streptomyces violascens TaxID=67381 RepID=UPI003686D325
MTRRVRHPHIPDRPGHHTHSTGNDAGQATVEQTLWVCALLVTSMVFYFVLPHIPSIKNLFGI